MKRYIMISAAVLGLCVPAFAANEGASRKDAAKEHLKNHYSLYGFIRNYFAYDSRSSVAGAGDLYYWSPKDNDFVYENGEVTDDKNAVSSFRFLALTSRVGLDVSGYRIEGLEFGAKVETDFYAGLTGSTGTAQLRLRQAFVTMKADGLGRGGKQSSVLKVGQAWHPMAADMPDIYSLETGAPFGPFSRTPLVSEEYSLGNGLSFTGALVWQMQYTSAGPDGASADYIKNGCTPEIYAGVSYRNGGFLGRVGYDFLSIKPRNFVGGTRVKDRMNASLGFVYLQYKKELFTAKAKTVIGQGGEHINLMSGYVEYVPDITKPVQYKYVPLNTSDTWVSLSYGKKYVGSLFMGYMQNLGTKEELPLVYQGYYNKNGVSAAGNNSWINRMVRIEPEFTYNIGKFTVGLEYMLTATQFGSKTASDTDELEKVAEGLRHGLALGNLHWVANHRVQAMVRFTF